MKIKTQKWSWLRAFDPNLDWVLGVNPQLVVSPEHFLSFFSHFVIFIVCHISIIYHYEMTCLTWWQRFPVLQDRFSSQWGKGRPTNLEEGNSSLHPMCGRSPRPTVKTTKLGNCTLTPCCHLIEYETETNKKLPSKILFDGNISTIKPVFQPDWKHAIVETANGLQVHLKLSVCYMLGFRSGSWSLWGKKELNLSKNLTLFTPLKPIADTYCQVTD